jgi:N-acetyl-gamma-glutamyl-phosphate reductase
MKKIKNIAIAGATGFSGIELIKILLKHPYANIKYLFAQSNIGKPMSFFDKSFKNTKLPLVSKFSIDSINKVDTIFTALPHGESHFISNVMSSKTTLIDLSADFRLEDKNVFQTWYKTEHKSIKNQKKAIYGLSEINKKKILKTNIIACPGCYPTSILLPLIPLIQRDMINPRTIKADSKSGYSGAGKKIYDKKLYPNNIYENIGIYGVAKHRHMPEIDQELSKFSKKKIQISFTPHILPTFRGMLSTIYVDLNKNYDDKKIYKYLLNFYKKDKFIKIFNNNVMINTDAVINTNNCHIGIYNNRFKGQLIIASAIDNLVKGAAGQAVQNFNIKYKFTEDLALNK